jgi:large subunit ribosomal protein L35
MPAHKRKTHKSLLKRVRVTRRGKVLRGLGGHSHLLSTKDAKRRRRLRTATVLDNPAMCARIAKCLNVYAPSRRSSQREDERPPASSEPAAPVPPASPQA